MALDLDKFIVPNGAPAAGKQAMMSSAFGPSDLLANTIVVKQASDLSGVLDSTKAYRPDGIIDMGTQSITVPPTGLTIIGDSFDVSGLVVLLSAL